MNKTDKTLTTLALILLTVLLVAPLVFHIHSEPQQTFGIAPSPAAITTNASTTIGTAAGLILAANTGALFRDICNPAPSTGTLYLWLNTTSSGFSGASGIALATTTCLQLSEQQGNMWLGNIYGLMSNVSTTITYHEQ